MRDINLANRITILRMVFIPVFLVVLLGELPSGIVAPSWWLVAQPWLAALIFAILAATDAVDGHIARSRNEITTFGKFIDPLADKLLVTAALVALVDLERLPSWIALVIISRELVVSGLRMVAVAEGRVIAASSHGKVKTVLQVVAIVCFLLKDSALLQDLLGSTGQQLFGTVSWVIMGAAIVMTVISMIDYFYHARDILTGPWEREG
ncbi:MAG: CDP-diacylglycerol-glycerol-3-phosphate 3-phosphatidyltransferase [Actinobacteria bacterium 66_15]|uniref:CDP-diacylglycerol--glycerol-3-phosphate 3-phosphatidyltransferase n=1 Tax=Anaerosoma tenue TaxID=2933588 RepID=UPI00076C245D|nr:CDP-diacylglycerol--glycerol-3-phosphate 3-phosphatidyltransferase [Anaerosoma tenue]KUK48762.1 MAG: CDP-diacylglycerol-glycerol-3-phosphate 3-phosphatidyltransferase [Actinobacteria bacterium 66_15]MCK8114242.1 CDP-diacylglycerol--glycerol-3-phosphate 3-phosphatidyltransferase [Anaerosoma tenue]